MPARSLSLERRSRVKKINKKDQEQNKKLRRLTLSRETIQVLNDPALLEVVGGVVGPPTCSGGTYDGSDNTAC